MSFLKRHWDALTDAIIRPPRAQYTQAALGRTVFRIDRQKYRREDLTVTNDRNQQLACSWWTPVDFDDKSSPLPCVIYCHGNCGSRCDAIESVALLLPEGYTVFALDFSGSGQSGGEFISLGCFEQRDLAAVVAHLRTKPQVSTIGLWGRSMGAATSIMYASTDPSIGGMVLDSPFTKLSELAYEIIESSNMKIPRMLVGVGLKLIRGTVKKRADFDIDDIDPSAVIQSTFVPALFAHASGDTFVGPHHSQKLASLYPGDQNLVTFEGDHNSGRPSFFHDSVIIFYHNTLQAGLTLPDRAPVALPDDDEASDMISHHDTNILSGNTSNAFIQNLMTSHGMGNSQTAVQGAVLQGQQHGHSASDREGHDGDEEDEGLYHEYDGFGGMTAEDIEEQQLQEALRLSMLEVSGGGDNNANQTTAATTAAMPAPTRVPTKPSSAAPPPRAPTGPPSTAPPPVGPPQLTPSSTTTSATFMPPPPNTTKRTVDSKPPSIDELIMATESPPPPATPPSVTAPAQSQTEATTTTTTTATPAAPVTSNAMTDPSAGQ
eukprot:GFYU01002462.1.p1 GENE.GFYU01002462.1~~GFYU01002462.1.p1  ORF type:complete len:567 (-),score=72.17 GFYU01002462.1:16-1656(-)